NLLKLFCNIKSRIYKRKSDAEIIEGKYEVCFPSYAMISSETGISDNNIKRYLDILVGLDLIRYKKSGTIVNKENGKAKDGANTYALFNENSEEEIKSSINLYKSKERAKGNVFKNSKISNNVKKLGGKKGAIKKKINSGKATIEDHKELEEIERKLAELRKPKEDKKIKEVKVVEEVNVFDILMEEDLKSFNNEMQDIVDKRLQMNLDIANSLEQAVKVSAKIAMDKCIKNDFDLDEVLNDDSDNEIDNDFLLGLISNDDELEV
ncbi:MAG: hypothetical protein ACRC3Y_07025, partial [Romboutsia sp.]